MAMRVLLRLPVELHRRLAEQAEEQGVSLNTWIVTLLAGAARFGLADEHDTHEGEK